MTKVFQILIIVKPQLKKYFVLATKRKDDGDRSDSTDVVADFVGLVGRPALRGEAR